MSAAFLEYLATVSNTMLKKTDIGTGTGISIGTGIGTDTSAPAGPDKGTDTHSTRAYQ